LNEAIDRLIAERQRLDAGLAATGLVSIAAHLVIGGLAFALPMLLPQEPPLKVADGFAVVLPRGGGGSPAAAPPAAAPAQPAPAPKPAPTVAPPPPQVLKPPTTQPKPRALPLPDSRRVAKRPLEPPPVPGSRSSPSAKPAAPAASVPGGRGTGTATPGLEFAPPGPGVPYGTDASGDWYLAGVIQKVWMQWNQQIRAGYTQSAGVTLTIQRDGSVTGLRVTQPSGSSLFDMAAQRAILNAAPFGPLPRDYGQTSRTLQLVFKPTE
jgi:TonB family protein